MSNTSRDANFEIVHGDQLKLIVIILVLHSWNSKILVPRWKDMESLAVWSSFNDTRPARWFGTFCIFPFSWEFKNPNWRTHIFQRGRLNYQLVILSVLSCLPERPTYFVRMFECCSGAGGQKKTICIVLRTQKSGTVTCTLWCHQPFSIGNPRTEWRFS